MRPLGAALLVAAAAAAIAPAFASDARDALRPEDLGVIYRRGDVASEAIAHEYQAARGIPARNVIGLTVPRESTISPASLAVLRGNAQRLLPAGLKAMLLVWTTPYAVSCMSITTAFAAGYDASFCEPHCAFTRPSPLYDAETLDSRHGWRPTMLLPSDDVELARQVIRRGLLADAGTSAGTAYLVATRDAARNVRAMEFADAVRGVGDRLPVRVLVIPGSEPPQDVLTYFTGVARVAELQQLRFVAGAVADHLTSVGGQLDHDFQTTALEWLRAGATASYGTVSEPCNLRGKFPRPKVFLSHYLRGETVLEAYWKSVEMPGQGLFVGEPLARPFGRRGSPP